MGMVFLSVMGIVSGGMEIELLSRAAKGGVTTDEADASDARQQVIGVVQLPFTLATGIAFFMWFHRVHKNLPALGSRSLKYTPGWAVGGFFVPFLNLVRPAQVMNEVWHASRPTALKRDLGPAGPRLRDRSGAPALVGWWWALFLASGILGRITTRMALAENPTLDHLQTLSGLLVSADVVTIPGVLLAVALIGRITGWQRERFDRLQQLDLEPPGEFEDHAGSGPSFAFEE